MILTAIAILSFVLVAQRANAKTEQKEVLDVADVMAQLLQTKKTNLADCWYWATTTTNGALILILGQETLGNPKCSSKDNAQFKNFTATYLHKGNTVIGIYIE